MSNNNNKNEFSDAGIPERGVTKVDSNQEPQPPKRVMSIHAHPDDQEFTVGGTLAKWARLGTEVITVCITSGDAGSNEHTPPDMTTTKLAPLREDEQRAACEILGIKQVVFLHYPDSMLTSTIELRRDLTRQIRKYKPDAVITSDPTQRFFGNSYMNHPDHRVAGDVACDAVFPSAGTRFIFPELLEEGLEPHEVSRVFLHGSDKPDVWIDISDTITAKVEALKQHKSQLADWDPMQMMSEWAKEDGKAHGVEMAEAFRVMVLKEEKPPAVAEHEERPAYAEAEK